MNGEEVPPLHVRVTNLEELAVKWSDLKSLLDRLALLERERDRVFRHVGLERRSS